MGFIDATPEERIIMILILLGLLTIIGIKLLYEKRKDKK